MVVPEGPAAAAEGVGGGLEAEAPAAAATACLGSGNSTTAGCPRADSPSEHAASTASLPLLSSGTDVVGGEAF